MTIIHENITRIHQNNSSLPFVTSVSDYRPTDIGI